MIFVQKGVQMFLERQSIYLSMHLGNYVNHCQCVPNVWRCYEPSTGTAPGEGRSWLCGGRILTISNDQFVLYLRLFLFCLFVLFILDPTYR